MSWNCTGLHATLVLVTCINTKLIYTRAHIKDTRACTTHTCHTHTHIHTRLTHTHNTTHTHAHPCVYTQHHSCTHQAHIHAERYLCILFTCNLLKEKLVDKI